MLYVVATPIGNLGDITLRAVETLGVVDLVASEDTRKTGRLLRHLGLTKRQISFHEHNEREAGGRIVASLERGEKVALVSSAGTPAISDPGYTLVRRVIEAGLPCSVVPGPSAVVAALVLSGLPVHAFTFRGFPPRKPGPRRRFLAIDSDSPHTLVFYESPHRLRALLEDALLVLGDRPAALANDLTKLYERVERGSLSALRDGLGEERLRGEFTLVVSGAKVG
jgi:16S rRNA (cytidine1402-2'-O)-methyltransferase